MLALLQHALMRAVDGFYACIPRKQPPTSALAGCKIIAHRGAHDKGAVENTLQAFREAREAGCWGIEFDLRWSVDDVPVVSHDVHGGRLFGDTTPLGSLTADQIRDRLPLIPTLAEVAKEFAGQLHQMIELKEPLSLGQAARLEQLLAPYTACRDYHFLALKPALFETLAGTSTDACLAVSEINTGLISQEVIHRHREGRRWFKLPVPRGCPARIAE